MKEGTMIKVTILVTGIMVTILLSAMSTTTENTTPVGTETDSLGYYKALVDSYKTAYQEAILDPAIRMKMVMGMPKDSAITWARKCHYELNIKALVKWRPDACSN